MLILKHVSLILCIVSFVLCMAAPLRKSDFLSRFPHADRLLCHHTFFAVILFITALIHGVLSKVSPAMMSGKIAWLFLIILILFSLFRKFMPQHVFLRIHRGMCVILALLIAVHVIHAVVA